MNTESKRMHAKIGVLAVAIFSFFGVHFSSQAASLYFKEPSMVVHAGDALETTLYFDADGESINAIEGTITFPAAVLELAEIRDGNSILNFWVEKPSKAQASSGSFRFSGIIPGGFSAQGGRVLSLVFTAREQGGASVTLADAHAYLNSPEASAAILGTGVFNAEILVPAGEPVAIEPKDDTEDPETFMPEVSSNIDLFEGRQFAVFDALDKGSGIDRYRVLETHMRYPWLALFSSWKDATSPYVLADQSGERYIFIKAIDRTGNTRVERILPTHPVPWYRDPNLLLIVCAAVLVVLVVARLLKKRFLLK